MTSMLSEEQLLLRDSARSFLEARSPVAELRRMRDAGESWSPRLWSEMAAMGWTGVVVPEEFGGLGFGCVGAGQIFEQCGHTLANSPLMASAVVGAKLVEALGSPELKSSLLPMLASGESILCPALAEGERWALEDANTTARAEADGYVLTGTKSQLAFAEAADHFLVSARIAGNGPGHGGLSLFLLNAGHPGLSVESRLKIDSFSSSQLRLDSVRVGPQARLGEPGKAWPAIREAAEAGAACSAAELLGMASEAFQRTLDYLKQREQFGRPIGSFQALQHRAALLHCELELTSSVVLQALQACEAAATSASMLANLAKARAVKTAQLAVNEAVQMHGGIGMTDEFDIGLFLKRANAAFAEFGGYHYHADRFALQRNY